MTWVKEKICMDSKWVVCCVLQCVHCGEEIFNLEYILFRTDNIDSINRALLVIIHRAIIELFFRGEPQWADFQFKLAGLKSIKLCFLDYCSLELRLVGSISSRAYESKGLAKNWFLDFSSSDDVWCWGEAIFLFSSLCLFFNGLL